MKQLKDIIALLCIAVAVAITVTLLQEWLRPHYITIQKSSDMPDWELSEKNYNDTVTVDTILFAYSDTAYRTIQYIRVDMKP